ncbi:MAG: hypothetical protein JWO38_6121, partial [Gemmataceae bacterium]|nr:hypothetical protein [Gemmataceae bacterium]
MATSEHRTRPTGRPSKLTPEMGFDLLTTIAAGYSRAEAARVARIDPTTL